jgi:retron-type reverse transcriptase
MARLVSGYTVHLPHHIKISIEFVQVLGSIQVNTHDIMVSFDIVSLFTKVPIRETMDLLRRHFEKDVLALFRHFLTTSYLTFNGQFYEQTDGVSMGSPLSLLITNFYMED